MPSVPIDKQKPQTPGGRRVRLHAAADYYGVHPKTLRDWGSKGSITLIRRGPRLLFVDLDELDALDSEVYTTADAR